MGKKIFFALLLLLLVIGGGFFLVRYINYLADDDPYKTFILPRVEMTVIEITSLDLDKTEMNAKVLIDNPMPFGFGADSIRYKIFISDEKVIESTFAKSVQITAADSSWISMPVTVFTKDLAAILKSSEDKGIDSVEYRITATFYTDLGFKKEFDVDITKLLPLLYIPQIEITDFKFDSLKFSGAGMELTTSIINKNKFPLKANNLAYKFDVSGEHWAEGIAEHPIDIPAQGSAPLTINLQLSFKEVGQTLWSLLKAKDSLEYDLALSLRMEAENNMLNNSKILLHSQGSLRSLFALGKKEKKEKKEAEKKEKTDKAEKK